MLHFFLGFIVPYEKSTEICVITLLHTMCYSSIASSMSYLLPLVFSHLTFYISYFQFEILEDINIFTKSGKKLSHISSNIVSLSLLLFGFKLHTYYTA